MPTRLNRRHQFALFTVLGIAGIAAVSGATLTQTAGILLLGLAFAWAFGSDSRGVHWSFVVVGIVLVLGVSILIPWCTSKLEARHYGGKVARFENKMPELARRYPLSVTDLENAEGHSNSLFPKSKEESDLSNGHSRRVPDGELDLSAGLVSKSHQRVIMPDGSIHYFRDSMSEDSIRKGVFRYGRTQHLWDEAREAGLQLSSVPVSELPGEPPEPFRLSNTLRETRPFAMVGSFFLVSGVGLILGTSSQPR